MRRNSAVALLAKSKCLYGDFGFGAVIVPPNAGVSPMFALRTPCGRVIPPLNDGCVWTRPCVAEKKLLSKDDKSPPGVVICDRHHDSAVDWSDLSEVSAKRKQNNQSISISVFLNSVFFFKEINVFILDVKFDSLLGAN